MARERIFKEIDDVQCEFFWLPMETAIKISARLTKLIMEPIGVGLAAAAVAAKAAKASSSASNVVEGAEVAAVAPAPEDAVEFPVDALSKALAAMSDRLDEAQVWDTCKTMIQATWVKFPGDGGTHKVDLNKDFEGRPGLLLKIVAAALEVNFQDFFGESSVVGQIASQAMAKAKATVFKSA